MTDSTSGHLRRLAVLLGALAMVTVSAYVSLSGSDSFAKPTEGGDPPFIPATYAFAIWLPIYLGVVAYGIWQTLPKQQRDPLLARIGWGSAAGFWLTALWLVVAQTRDYVWFNVAILASIVAALFVAVSRIESARDDWSAGVRRLVRPTLSTFLGWTSLATFANLAGALRWSGITEPGSENGVTLALLGAATAAAVLLERRLRGNRWYVGAALWAIVAIIVANVAGIRREPNTMIALAAGGAGLLVLLGALIRPSPPRGHSRGHGDRFMVGGERLVS